MPKRRSNPTTVEELESEMEAAAEEVMVKIEEAAEVEESAKPEKVKADTAAAGTEVERKSGELVVLAKDGDLDKSVAFVKKANKKIVERLYDEYERKRERKANEFLTDLIISKFAALLGGLDAIADVSELTLELSEDELLRTDVYSAVQSITPYLPLLGVLSGGITTAKHVAKHKLTDQQTRPEVEAENTVEKKI
jgi:hypothetical protein